MVERFAVIERDPAKPVNGRDQTETQSETRRPERFFGYRRLGPERDDGEVSGSRQRRGCQVSDPRRRENPHSDRVEDGIARKADHGNLRLESAENAGPDRERHPQVMTVPRQPLIRCARPVVGENDREPCQQGAENQAVDRPEWLGKRLVAHRPPHELFDRMHPVSGEIMRPEVRDDQAPPRTRNTGTPASARRAKQGSRRGPAQARPSP